MKTQRKLLSRAALRRPFIVTVSAAAAVAAAACGGSTIDDETTAPSEIVGTSNPPPPAVCPAAQPAHGDACDIALTETCGYKDCFGSPAVSAKCEADGKWSVAERSCNPPRPPACPETQPTAGDACNPALTETCGYKDCFGSPSVSAKCDADGKWSVAERSCNPPPPPVCPATQPTAGDACDTALTETCGYKDCFGSPAVSAKCEADGKWSVAERSCNPPPPPPSP